MKPKRDDDDDCSVLQTTELCKYHLLYGIVGRDFGSSKFEYKTFHRQPLDYSE